MKTVAYWVSTGLVVFFIGSGGIAYAMQAPDVVQGVVALGFPVHFVVLLGVWKVLGSIAIAVPGFSLLKEWAYAGIMFDLTGAASASLATGGDVAVVFQIKCRSFSYLITKSISSASKLRRWQVWHTEDCVLAAKVRDFGTELCIAKK